MRINKFAQMLIQNLLPDGIKKSDVPPLQTANCHVWDRSNTVWQKDDEADFLFLEGWHLQVACLDVHKAFYDSLLGYRYRVGIQMAPVSHDNVGSL